MKGTNETEVLLVRINRLFGLFIQNREIYLKNVGQKVSALEPDVRKYITSDIPEVLRLFVDWENYKIKGSVGAGRSFPALICKHLHHLQCLYKIRLLCKATVSTGMYLHLCLLLHFRIRILRLLSELLPFRGIHPM